MRAVMYVIFQRVLAVTIAALILAPRHSATWSIVVVDTATGEVCVASATCLKGVDLLNLLPVMQVGVGGAAAQSAVDLTAKNRFRIWQGFLDGTSPTDILAELAANDSSHAQRQYGIVNLTDTPTKFTGNKAGQARASVKGVSGTLRYAVQGNVLTGKAVVFLARKSLIQSTGDLAQRVMLAMEVARDLGGDGRCSCSMSTPDGCGVPPPQFNTSATVSFIILSRIGDTDGVCNASDGCANGDYYLSLNVTPGKTGIDSVTELRTLFDTWRSNLAGHPDHLLSVARSTATALPADGRTTTRVRVHLRDLNGAAIKNNHSQVQVSSSGGAGLTTIGPVVSHGNGAYSFDVTAGTQTGMERLIITADDGVKRATLYPYLEIRLDPAAELHCGLDFISAEKGGALVPFAIDFGSAASGEGYMLLGSGSGTVPGLFVHGIAVPLNLDSIFELTAQKPGPPMLPHSRGVLDPNGRARAFFRPGPHALNSLIGLRLDWAVLTTGGRVAGPVGFDVQ